MSTEERTKLDRHEARLEKLEKEVGVIAVGEAANAQRTSDTRAELDRQSKQLGDRVTLLDFDVTQKLDAMSAEHAQHKALLEDVQRQVRVLADGQVANAQRIEETKSALEHQIKQVDHRVMVLDVKVHEKLAGLEARMDSKLEGLEARMDSKLEGLGNNLSRIAAHLGLNGAPHPEKRL